MRSLVILGAVLLAACGARHGSTSTPAPTAAVIPCDAPVPSADSLQWKLVQASGFTFCVPPGWRPSGAKGWRAGGSAIEWAVGAPPPVSETMFRVPAKSTEPVPLPRHFVEIVGGTSAELSDTHLGEADYTSAQWAEKRVYFRGKAMSPRSADIELMIYRTVRFTADDHAG